MNKMSFSIRKVNFCLLCVVHAIEGACLKGAGHTECDRGIFQTLVVKALG